MINPERPVCSDIIHSERITITLHALMQFLIRDRRRNLVDAAMHLRPRIESSIPIVRHSSIELGTNDDPKRKPGYYFQDQENTGIVYVLRPIGRRRKRGSFEVATVLKGDGNRYRA